MIIEIVGGVLVASAIVLLLRALYLRAGLTPGRIALLVVVVVATLGLFVLIATGRVSWLFAAGAAIAAFGSRLLSVLSVIPVLNRVFPGWHRRFGGKAWRSGPRAGESRASEYSTIDTPGLRMTLHHKTGHMEGEVLSGTHRGRFLSELDATALVAVLASLTDAESKRLLTAYLDRVHAGWNSRSHAQAGESDQMDRAKALAVLGLAAGATPEEVVAAHRRLIQKLHPDRGGSTYLATTLNEAKRVLLDG